MIREEKLLNKKEEVKLFKRIIFIILMKLEWESLMADGIRSIIRQSS